MSNEQTYLTALRAILDLASEPFVDKVTCEAIAQMAYKAITDAGEDISTPSIDDGEIAQ